MKTGVGNGMSERKDNWKTWWWYHKLHVLLAIAVAAVILYSFLPGLLVPKPDYGVGVITNIRLPDESYSALQNRVRELADDRNGDGKVVIELNWYLPDLSGKTEGSLNYQEASRLDADLVGKVSDLFLIEDMDGFRKNVVTPVAEGVPAETLSLFEGIPLPEGTVFTVRTDSDAQTLYERILEKQIKSPATGEESPAIEDVVQIDADAFSCSFDGVKHRFLLDLPEVSADAPLVIMLHGYGNTAESFRTAVHFEREANELGYAVAYVTGAPDPNVPTSSTGWHSETNTDGNRDAEFLISLVRYLQDSYGLNRERVYAVGFSNGGLMAHRLAMEAGDVFSACVSVAGWMPKSVWEARREVNEIGFFQITGEKDDAVPKNSDGSARYHTAPAIEDVVDYWAESNGLSRTETSSVGKSSVLSIYSEKEKPQQIWSLFVTDGRHSWPDSRFSGVDTNALILEFFEAQK